MSNVIEVKNGMHDFCFHYTFDEEDRHSINVNTFANSLVKLSEVLQSIAQHTLPDYEIEITIDKAGEGTFWTKFNLNGKSLFTKLRELLPQKDNTIPVLLTICAIFQTAQANKKNAEPNIKIENDYVIFNDSIKIDKETYNTALKLKGKPEIQESIQKTFHSILIDKSIKAVAFATDIESAKKHNFLLSITSNDFTSFDINNDEHNIKYDVRESQEIVPVKVFLEKTNRKWEFVWDGRKISANITCDKFYNDLINGRIFYNQKDKMIVTLKIKQKLDKIHDVYINESYEIIFVKSYIKFQELQSNLL
jgi:hypothetical protein